MMQDKPFIHLLKSPYYSYMYDVNTNEIICISDECYRYLSALLDKSQQQSLPVPTVAEEIDRLQAAGYLKSKRPDVIENPQIDTIGGLLENGLLKLTMQVTQECNFRCSYCDYSNDDGLRNRMHSQKRMSWDTAKRAIDFFSRHIRDTKMVNFGFYGGEPLLEFDLIRQCIEYIEQTFEGKVYSFALTTNGSPLSLEVAKFLYEKNVSLTVSLDGPKEIHDSNRRFAESGAGTFDAIMHNLEMIRVHLPEYYAKVNFNSVIDPLNDYDCTRDYFCERHAGGLVMAPFMAPQTGTRSVFSEEFEQTYRNELLVAFLYLHNVLEREEAGPMATGYADSLRSIINTHFTKRFEIPSRIGHGGPCLPGVMRLFVDIDGKLFPCERVSESTDAMNIGHIDEGFYLDKAVALLNIAQLTEESCKNCWAITHCKVCARDADDTKQLSAEKIRKKCKSVRADVEADMLDCIAFYETRDILHKSAENCLV